MAQVTMNLRDGITAPDTSIAGLTRYGCLGATAIRIGSICDTAKATSECRVVLYDGANNLIGVSAAFVFTADPTAVDSGSYLATPNTDAWVAVAGASEFALTVDTVSGGKWTFNTIAG